MLMNSFSDSTKITLFVVEDSGEFAEMIGEFFSEFFEITVFTDALEALTQAALTPPDAVLTDLRQAEQSRKELIKKMVELKHGINVYMVSMKPDSAQLRFQHRDADQVRKLPAIDLPGVLSEILQRATPSSKSA
jgi:DNA-binding response OmpR family regulator